MTVAEMTETRFRERQRHAAVSAEVEYAPAPIVAPGVFRAKQVLDCVLAALMLIPALPVIGLLVLAIRLTSRGPGVFKQVRVGRGGKVFTMYKLRSMRLDAEVATGPAWSASAKDPRVTWLGYWLRRLHLDELPQLLNVLRGEMSLVGPRPERPEFVHVLADQVPGYLNRLVVRPGITGLAQINLPPDSDLNSVRQKLAVDLDYIGAATIWLDLRIMFCTALRIVWIKGPLITRLLGLERKVFAAGPAAGHDQPQPVRVAELLDCPRGKSASRTAASQA